MTIEIITQLFFSKNCTDNKFSKKRNRGEIKILRFYNFLLNSKVKIFYNSDGVKNLILVLNKNCNIKFSYALN